ncbi:1-aminocyclopropane-1-carboxylate deaminase/D-cysteine desulfhydrase [Allosediminivita pacifica]|uniref:D-cysteine desulfhydrase n=1 Tax=Allosediminivita pacifica TaxID=1267769 RepID=A0A2T6ADB2_9RHOB|nr:D-cysteine desulfhydrase family protein [Allosediminivita pacifica]PTX41762.1 D-cysteine desulfhydrase [Allosediminivita pacifica]GGB22726.1 D-cysteine desulfhydrase [Allosediminivita pacifica]
MKLDELPRLSLGFLPTPVEDLKTLGAELGISLSVKRDDFTGFGGGGNKVRKLEFLMADAVAQGVSTVITTGGHQSNHARMTAAAARKFGMKPVLVLRGNKPDNWQGNLLLDHILGAEVDFLDPDAYFEQINPRMQAHADAAEARGEKAYIIPLGGASALGAMGYVNAIRELAEQYEAQGRKAPDYICAPVGSGGTLAGMTVGCSMWWPNTQVLGIAVTGTAVPFSERISVMANDAAELLGLDQRFAPEDIRIENDYVGPGYSIPSDEGNAAILRAGRTEGVLLDPVYTGKAMAGIIGTVQAGGIEKGSDVLFVHCGGTPALFPFSEQLTADLTY